jgi:hypothetical protein
VDIIRGCWRICGPIKEEEEEMMMMMMMMMTEMDTVTY